MPRPEIDGAGRGPGIWILGAKVEIEASSAPPAAATSGAAAFLGTRGPESSGATELPRGIGVLPMLDSDPAAASYKGFATVFQGSQGDAVIWALSLGALPSPIPLGGIGHGLQLDPATLIMMPGLEIADPGGTLRVEIPPTPIPATIYLQAVFATSIPGYGPAAFSNLMVVNP